jgi:hypothetical protein
VDLLHFSPSPADNDTLGYINMGGYYSGTSSAYFSSIRTVATDISARQGEIQFWTVNTTLQQRMVIDTDGNVGIGTPTPTEKLHLKSTTSGSFIRFEDNGGSGVYVGARSNDLEFYAGGSEKMVILSGGNVGIGATSPGQKLEVSGNTYVTGYVQANSALIGNKVISSVNYATFGSNSTAAGVALSRDWNPGTYPDLIINPSGNVGIGTTLPTTALTIRKAIPAAPSSYGLQASMVEFKSYYPGYDTETVKSAIYSGVSDQTTLQTTKGYMSFWTSSEINPAAQNLTEKMRIEANGNVGIGVTSPSYKLDVSGNIRSSTVTVYDGMGGTETGIGASSAGGNLRLYAGGTNKVTVTNTAQSLILYGNSTTGSNYMQFNDSAGTSQGYVGYGSSGNNIFYFVQFKAADFNFYLDGAVRGAISTAGTLTMQGDVIAYGSPSDRRLKENIKPIESALDKVSKLQGVTFDWKEKEKEYDQFGKPKKLQEWKNDIGFIAQDVQKVVPELVRENENGMLSMRHQGIAPILLEAIKELKAEIDELKKQIK